MKVLGDIIIDTPFWRSSVNITIGIFEKERLLTFETQPISIDVNVHKTKDVVTIQPQLKPRRAALSVLGHANGDLLTCVSAPLGM